MTTSTYDIIVVGAGSAGCALAGRLAERGSTRVLVLEAGGSARHPNVKIPAAFSKLFMTKRDWKYATVPQPALDGRAIYWPRGRMIGGCSAMNAQLHIRGHRADFDGWAAAGNDGWSYDDLLPLFRRSERRAAGANEHRGGEGPLHVQPMRSPSELAQAFVEAAATLGIPRVDDLNTPNLRGVALTEVTQRRGSRWSAADAYLTGHARKSIEIRSGRHVARVVVERGRATGVELVGGDRVAGGLVVLAGGTVNSPQLLMCSGIGPAPHLAGLGIEVVADLPGVGSNLQDHLAIITPKDVNVRSTLAGAERPGPLLNYLIRRRGMLTSPVAEAAAFVRSDGGDGPPDLELLFGNAPFEEQGLAKPDRHAIAIAAALLTPASRGTIRLPSADPTATPLIDPNYLSDESGLDLARLMRGLEMVGDLFESVPLRAALRSREHPPDPIAHIRRFAHTLYHPVGTCRMGTDDTAVVDPSLRVHGVDRLMVADCSVIPTIIRGHTNAVAIVVGERAADLISSPPVDPANDIEAASGQVGRGM